MNTLTLVIPCFNEEKNIPLILERLSPVMKRIDVKVLLVNNGSTDGSQEVLNLLIPKYTFAESLRIEKNQGYGFGILAGLRIADGKYIGWTHADMQTDPLDMIRGLEILEKSPNPLTYVKGARKRRPLADQFFTFGMSIFESLYMRAFLWDINAQPNIFPKSFFDKWMDPPSDFSLDLYAYYQAKRLGYKVVRFPVIFPPRIHGHSSWNTGLKSKWKFIKRTFEFSLKLKKGLEK